MWSALIFYLIRDLFTEPSHLANNGRTYKLDINFLSFTWKVRRYLANPSKWEAFLSGPRYLFILCHHKDLFVQRGREQTPSLKWKDSTSSTLFWLSPCFLPACRRGWAWLFMCAQSETAMSEISTVLHGRDGKGMGGTRAPCPLLMLCLRNRGQFKQTKQTCPPPPAQEVVYCAHSRELKGCWYKTLSVCFVASLLKHSATMLVVWTGSESLLTYKEFPWPWLF